MVFARLFLLEEQDAGFVATPFKGGGKHDDDDQQQPPQHKGEEKKKKTGLLLSDDDLESLENLGGGGTWSHRLHFLRRRFVARGATVGYLFIAVVAATTSVEALSGSENENSRFFFWHNGGLLPLFALLVAGLCSDRDVVTAAFKRLSAIGAISYAQYILQGVVFHIVSQAYRAAYVTHPSYHRAPFGAWSFQLVLPAVLFVSAGITHYFLSVPCADHLRRKLDAFCANRASLPSSGADTAKATTKRNNNNTGLVDDDSHRGYGATGSTSNAIPPHAIPPFLRDSKSDLA